MNDTNNFLNKEGKIKVWPSKQSAKQVVLRYLGSFFDTGRFYTEKEINLIIDEHHIFGDYFLLRRELINHGILVRTPNGARYWRGSLWPEYEVFHTGRISIHKAAPDDAVDIEKVYFACSPIGDWAGQPFSDVGLASLLDGSDLPPEGSREFNHLVVLRDETGNMLGLAQYYTAWPKENCMWIGLFLLHPDYQRQGFGREFISAFVTECRQQNYGQIGMGVALRNQVGLKFWASNGFGRISTVLKDGEKGEGSLGLLGLKMDLAEL
jgi:hypothetical protein